MIERVLRAMRLEPALFQEVARETRYTTEATLLAIVIAIISSLGVLFTGRNAVVGFVAQVMNNLLLGWVLWALVAYFVGRTMYQGKSNPGEMLRVLAYASLPRLLLIFNYVEFLCVGWIIATLGWFLSIIAGIIAIREAMEFDMNKAVITATIGFVLYVIATFAIGAFFGNSALPFGG